MDANVFSQLRRAIDAERTVVLATIVEGPGAGRQVLFDSAGTGMAGTLGSPELDTFARERAAALVPGFGSAKVTGSDGGQALDLFIEIHGPRPQLVVIGAVHVAVTLVHLARLLGYRTVVIDPRPVFATPERFAHADALVVEWPDEAFERVHLHDNTAVAVLSHDLKIDVPALTAALRRRLPYIGALGSKKTQDKRRRALLEEGFTEADLACIRSPIGLDIGGRRAEHVALAIMAEIVAVTQGGSAARAGRATP